LYSPTGLGVASIKVAGLEHAINIGKSFGDRSVFRQVILDRWWEGALRPLREKPPRVIVDGGAHIGLCSVTFANIFPEALIIAVEPNPRNFELLRLNADPYPNIRVVNAALWWRDGFIDISNPDGDSWAFRVEESASNSGIPSVTIPTLLRQAGVSGSELVDILKLDIEGAEKELLAHGADEWIDRVRMLCIELHDRFKPGCVLAFEAALSGRVHQRFCRGEMEVVNFCRD
jgi:FkbM family methyltransferase